MSDAPSIAPWIAAQTRQLLAQRGHAWLLQGPSGLGQYDLATALVSAWLCEDPTGQGACGVCASCHAIAVRTHADLAVLMPETVMIERGWPLGEKAQGEIDDKKRKPSKEIRVEAMRDTVEFAQRTSARGRGKAVLVYPAERMNPVTANALLKTLEEPPAHVKFIFATTDPQKMPATVISRCQRFDLKPIPTELIVQRLKKIAVAEKIKVSDAALASIARMADGGMRDAQSIFDQMISFCGNEVSEADVLDVYGLVAADKIAALARALAAGDHRKIVELVNEADENGRDLYRLLVDVQVNVREALLAAIAQGGSSDALGTPMTTEQLTRLLDGLREGENGVKHGLSEKINFEVALLKAVEASRARAIDSLIKEIATLADSLPEDGSKKND